MCVEREPAACRSIVADTPPAPNSGCRCVICSPERMGLLRRTKAHEQSARPEIDLTAWAESRGLEFRDGAPQAGYLSVTCPWSADLLFNVVRGHWSGGTYGVLCHEARIFGAGVRGWY